jgi:hypothetical protein
MKGAFFTVDATRTLNSYDLPRKSKMREMCTKCGVAPKGSILNICRLRLNIYSPDLNTGTWEQQRAAVDTTGGDCHVNALAKRQKTQYISTLQWFTRLSKQSLLSYQITLGGIQQFCSRCCHGKISFVSGGKIPKAKYSSLKETRLSLVLSGKSVWI